MSSLPKPPGPAPRSTTSSDTNSRNITSQQMDAEVGSVVRSGNCSGCGMCAILDSGLTMQITGDGYSRPTRTASGKRDADALDRFRSACPGKRVSAQRPDGSTWHPTMGPVTGIWAAWAKDPEVRRLGSSGGALTALSEWLVASGASTRVVAAGAEPANPRRTVSVTIMSRDEALRSAGSRYAPVSVAANPAAIDPKSSVVGKPCEISALRALAEARGEEPPLLLSFYCAGTPRQSATTQLLESLGVDPALPLRDLWYRGRGWPGRFTAVREDGTSVSSPYADSWGEHLGPTIQWRCKLCPDGVGESADISAADLWETDEGGSPVFAEGEGVSALIARTRRGWEAVENAIAAGVLIVRPIDIADLAAVQPTHRKRRETLLGRLAGTMLTGSRVPRFSGFRLARLGLAHPLALVRTARGTFARARAARSRS